MSEHPTTHHEHVHAAEHTHHAVPLRVYIYNFIALMVLLVLTLVAAKFDLGEWNVVIAVTIAVIKAVLVVLYFMHLRFSTRLVQVFGGAAMFWLAILFTLTFTDYFSRFGNVLPAG
jgi:cytochrome c oxidase subunit IV